MYHWLASAPEEIGRVSGLGGGSIGCTNGKHLFLNDCRTLSGTPESIVGIFGYAAQSVPIFPCTSNSSMLLQQAFGDHPAHNLSRGS